MKLMPPGLWVAFLLVVAGPLHGQHPPGDRAGGASGAQKIVVCGYLLDSDGRPVSESRVVLIPVVNRFEQAVLELAGTPQPEPVASALPDHDGFFRLVAPEAGMWAVVARAAGFVPMAMKILPLTEETVLPAVYLPRDVALNVRLSSRGGDPIAGGRVRVEAGGRAAVGTRRKAAWEPAPRVGASEEDGTVALPRAGGENLVIRVIGPRHEETTISAGRRRHLTAHLVPGEARLIEARDGRLRPMAGVMVWIGEGAWPVGQTGDDGRLPIYAPASQQVPIKLLAADGHSAATLLEPLAPEGTRDQVPVVVDLSPPVTLRGRVLAARQRMPVARAIIWLASDPGWCRFTDSGGGFELPAPAGTRAWLLAAAAGFFQENANLGLLLPGPFAAPTMVLMPKVAVSGRVEDELGNPLDGVAIVARFDPRVRQRGIHLSRSGGMFRSSPSGKFRIEHLVPEVPYKLRFSKDSFAPLEIDLPGQPLGATPTGLTVTMRSGLTATGLVTDDRDDPIANAALTLTPRLSDDLQTRIHQQINPDVVPAFTAATNLDGRYQLRDLAAGTYLLKVEATGFATLTVPGLVVAESPLPVDLGTVVMSPAAVVQGEVVDSDGEPLEGVEVRIVPTGAEAEIVAMLRPTREPLGAVTDVNGRFSLDGQAHGAALKLSFTRSGFTGAFVSGITAPTAEPLHIVLHPAAKVTGHTLDAAGRPVAHALVTLSRPQETQFITFRGTDERSTVSDEDGFFFFSDVEAGKAELSASARGYQNAPWQTLEVPEGRVLAGTELVLSPGGTITGTVTSPAGEPVFGAAISWFGPEALDSGGGPGGRFINQITSTDGDGNYLLDGVPPARLSIAANHDHHGRTVRDLEVVLGENLLDLRFEGGFEVTGRVIDETGIPVSDASVELLAKGLIWDSRQRISGPEGEFQFTGLSPGTYDLYASEQAYARMREPVPVRVDGSSVHGVEIEISKGGAIVGRIVGIDLDDLDELEVSAGYFATGEVNYDQSYRISNLEPGDWTVIANLARSGRRAEGKVTLEPGVSEVSLDLVFATGLTLTGEVRLNGAPISGGTVSLSGGDLSTPLRTETDPGGSFRLSGLQAGRYRLNLTDQVSDLRHSEILIIDSDRNLLIEVEAATISGVVVDDYDRAPLNGGKISLIPGSTGQSTDDRTTYTDYRGGFRFNAVTAGEWRLVCSKPGYAEVERRVAIEGGMDVTGVEFALSATEGLRLEVTLLSGQYPQNVHAAVLNAAGKWVAGGTYPVGERGRVHLTTAPQGPLHLLIAADGTGTVARRPVDSTRPVPVVLPATGALAVRVPELERGNEEAELTLAFSDGRRYRAIASGGRVVSRWPLRHGGVLVRDLPAGTWIARVTTKSGRRWQAYADVSDGGMTNVDLDTAAAE